MHQIDLQELECLLALAEELHFGRTAERLGYSQSRASQLIASIERHVGARLVKRTSRTVSLTRLGRQFVDDVRPAYRGLARTYKRAREQAMRGALQDLRIGFTGTVYEDITHAFRNLHRQFGISVHAHDLPLGSPFTALLDGEIDAAIVELPVEDAALTVGYRFPPQDQFVALAPDHRFAGHATIDVEDLAEIDLLHRTGTAPDAWKLARTPAHTPSGAPIRSTAGISTMQQGLTLAASGAYGMLVCRPVTEHSPRSDLRFVPVRGLEGASQLALIWRRDDTGPSLGMLADLLRHGNSPLP